MRVTPASIAGVVLFLFELNGGAIEMRVACDKWVHCLDTGRPLICSVPHDGLPYVGLGAPFAERAKGIKGRDQFTAAFVADLNTDESGSYKNPVASVVRGLLPRSVVDYNRSLEDETMSDVCEWGRLSHEYFHCMLDRLLEWSAFSPQSRTVLLDVHGFAHQPTCGEYDVVFGTRNGSTVRTDILDRLASHLDEYGFRVFVPREKSIPGERYAGGYIVQSHASPGVDAIQMEISREVRLGNEGERSKELARTLRTFFLKQ